MKASHNPELLEALERRLAASKQKIVILGKAQKREPVKSEMSHTSPRRSQTVRAQLVEAIANATAKRQKRAPIESMETRAERARNVERLVAALKREKHLA
jgi:hypothetical protein